MQEDSSQPSEGLRFSLASKFTSEKPVVAKANDALVQVVGGVDPASRPAGLTLRTPATTDPSTRSSSVPALGESSSGAEVDRKPVRRTIDWTPTPLLCKRLNVPVPKASSTADWTIMGGDAATPVQDVPAPLRKFVPESSASSLPKVRVHLFVLDHAELGYHFGRECNILQIDTRNSILFSLFSRTLASEKLSVRCVQKYSRSKRTCTHVGSELTLTRTCFPRQMPLLKGTEQRHPVGVVPASVTSTDATADAVAEGAPKERPPIDLFKSIFESESESESEDEDGIGGEGTSGVADEAEVTPSAPPTEVRRAPESLLDKKSLHRGYGTDSSDESTVDTTGQLGAAHRVDGYRSRELEKGGRSDSGSKRTRGKSDNTSRKHCRKHKKHKKDKKHRKHDKRKKKKL